MFSSHANTCDLIAAALTGSTVLAHPIAVLLLVPQTKTHVVA